MARAARRLPPFERLGAFVHAHARLVIGAWVLIVLCALPFAPQAPGALQAGGFDLPTLESARSRAALESELGAPPSALVLAISSSTLTPGTPQFEAAAQRAVAGVANAPHVVGSRSHLIAPTQVNVEKKIVYDVILLDLKPDDSPAALEGIQAALVEVDGIKVALAGGPSFYADIQIVSETDLQRSELISLPLAAIVLLLVFGSAVAAGLPLAVGGATVIVALAAIFGAAQATRMSIFVLNLTTLLGLGLGVDYSLLLVSRFREELGRGAKLGDAVQRTVATAGRAVFFSGVTVMLGLAGLALFDFAILRSIGIAGAITVAIAVASSVTLMPAILSLLGPRVNRLAIRRLGSGKVNERGPWARLARAVMRRPIAVALPTLALLIALGTPWLGVRFNAPDGSILPERVPSRQALDALTDAFGEGSFSPMTAAVRTDGPVTSAANIKLLYDWVQALQADPRVARVDSIVSIDPRLTLTQYQLLYSSSSTDGATPPDRYAAQILSFTTAGDLTTVSITPTNGPNRPESRALVGELRAAHPGSIAAGTPSAITPPAGLNALIGGGAAEIVDVVDTISGEFPRTAAVVILATLLILAVLLRSIVLPIKAVVMNTLSILASFGALVWIFQEGNLSAILGFAPLGFVETTIPVILFCVLFGLSMDYEVFLLTRMREIYDRTGDNAAAVAGGLERSGRIITSAALIVVVVAGSFVFAEIVLIKALGVGVAIAVALDATIVRALLVPATMRLFGKWNWWAPRWMERLLSGRIATEAETEARAR
ncbi:MAG: MMPL family transporter [Candidatus Limnocylindrus sp. ZSMar2m-chloro-G89]|nr:MAG: MMPL family transporter [Candidatus Limnocylindrus sp.]RLT48639.1 MAG: MMPL family transporter [Candidatus Limnocylindrus sp. ZSMar2m-chloro-G89]